MSNAATRHPLHPQLPAEVDAEVQYGECWPADQPFPLTPDECMALVMGFAVKPKNPMTMEEFRRLPGRFEGGPRVGIVLHRS